jgi:hypothetical protein
MVELHRNGPGETVAGKATLRQTIADPKHLDARHEDPRRLAGAVLREVILAYCADSDNAHGMGRDQTNKLNV